LWRWSGWSLRWAERHYGLFGLLMVIVDPRMN
jgi:hypothetical protein